MNQPSWTVPQKEEEGNEHKKRSVPSPAEDKPSPTEHKKDKEEEARSSGTQEEKGQESALEHPCSGVFSVKHIFVVGNNLERNLK